MIVDVMIKIVVETILNMCECNMLHKNSWAAKTVLC